MENRASRSNERANTVSRFFSV